VAGGPAAPQIVIVECGKIVVDQRVGVEHLEGCAELLDASGQRARDHAPCFHTEHRS
jgi:hypothetical protein